MNFIQRYFLSQRSLLNESFTLLTEGKHWPEDYLKTAFNTIKSSPLGKTNWYKDEYILQDLVGKDHDIANIDKHDLNANPGSYGILGHFVPMMHKNSNLGFFATLIRWFIEYAGTDPRRYADFIETKLDNVARILAAVLNDPSYDKLRDEIKTKWSFKQFEELMKDVIAKQQSTSDEKMKDIKQRDDYIVVPIGSYEEMNERYGEDVTGFEGESEWCHTNGKHTYDSWTKNEKGMFFVLERKGWENIHPDPDSKNPYDDYGMSLIAILVSTVDGSLLRQTLRWNHIKEAYFKDVNPGASTDHAFKDNWGDLCQAVGLDVKKICENELNDVIEQHAKKSREVNQEVERLYTEQGDDFVVPRDMHNYVTNIVVPSNVTSIRDHAFWHCTSLTSIVIPDSVESIGHYVFDGCESLKHIIIPDSVKSIGNRAFGGCRSLTSIVIPDSVKSIGDATFYVCTSLTSIVIPDSVQSIGDGAFNGCTNLTSIVIPDSVESIGYSAFGGCESLKSIEIPDSVEFIRYDAFLDCYNLEEVVFKGKTLDEVEAMENYSFGIEDKSVIKTEF